MSFKATKNKIQPFQNERVVLLTHNIKLWYNIHKGRGDIMELSMVVAIIGCVIGVLSFFFGRKEKGEASSYKMGQIDEKLATISNQIEKLSQKLDNYDMEIDSRIEKAIEIHIQMYHKGE